MALGLRTDSDTRRGRYFSCIGRPQRPRPDTAMPQRGPHTQQSGKRRFTAPLSVSKISEKGEEGTPVNTGGGYERAGKVRSLVRRVSMATGAIDEQTEKRRIEEAHRKGR